ncbi:MAG TPA: nuclear transport factor 2 family protein [Acidobacteriaceae bacterium]
MITAAYAAFNRRDMDAILAMMHPDVDWPNAITGGRLHGRDEVREYWRGQWETLDPKVEPLRVEDVGNGQTVVDVHQVVRDLSGKILVDQSIQHVYVIEDGLIARMDIRIS